MRKHDLIRIVADETNQTQGQASAAVNAVFSAIEDAMARGEEVTISGFGSFRVVKRAEWKGRHPRTGNAMTINAPQTPAFRPGSRLKRTVAGA